MVPEPSDVTPGIIQYGKTKSKGTGKLHGMSLAWRGVNLLGVALLVSVAWFIGAWVRHGRAPLGLSQPDCKVSPCFTPTQILPPTWLVVILGFMVLISIFMMVLGTQDVISNHRLEKEGGGATR